MFIITLRRLKIRIVTALVTCLILSALCWGIPRAYAFFASTDEKEFEKLEDPVRVDAGDRMEDTAQWLNAFGDD